MASQPPAPPQTPQENQPNEFQEQPSGSRFLLFNAVPSWLVSAILHVLLIILLVYFDLPGTEKTLVEILSEPQQAVEVEEMEEVKFEPTDMAVFEDSAPMESIEMADTTFDEETFEVESFEMNIETPNIADQNIEDVMNASAPVGVAAGSQAMARSGKSKEKMLKEGGGNAASEAAVLDALRWIARHQLPDGSWSFDHTIGPGDFRNTDGAGEHKQARFAATAMAVLPFLGAGQTHLEGEASFKKAVRGGLTYLVENQQRVSLPGGAVGGSFYEAQGNMYSHGLATIAICEAYAMTKDRDLLYPSQAAINFIVDAQDPTGGGWRYRPKQGGDTSVVGWQFMGLKSGQMGFLDVPKRTIGKAAQFLDSVQADSGAKYGYVEPAGRASTTAIGLLCRMYLGWDKENPGMERGVAFLSKEGPSKNNMYYNYYATQVMRHYGGEEWEKWNGVMRDYLIKQQEKEGNKKGSWFFNHQWSRHGGRLYDTSLSCMTLEVYYRHLPIYGSKAADEEFQLD